MNKDSIEIEAAKAAALVKSTAESTATALNIQNIQNDIKEIKTDIRAIVEKQDGKVEKLEIRIDNIAKMVWIGMGIAIAASFISPFIQKLIP